MKFTLSWLKTHLDKAQASKLTPDDIAVRGSFAKGLDFMRRFKEIMGDDAHMIDDMTPREMYNMLREARADIMLSGGRSQFVALKARMPWLDINQEREFGYAGYTGMVELARQLACAINSPIWQQVRTPAPWSFPRGALAGAQTRRQGV